MVKVIVELSNLYDEEEHTSAFAPEDITEANGASLKWEIKRMESSAIVNLPSFQEYVADWLFLVRLS